MILKNTVTFRIDVCERPTEEEFKKIWPLKFKKYQFVPQTVGDQIWMWFEFESKEARDTYVALLPEKFKGFISEFKQSDLDYWEDWDK
jgi:hypothetical protein